MRKSLTAILVMAFFVLTGTPAIHARQESDPVTLRLVHAGDIDTILDPQRAESQYSHWAVEQLFLGLTNFDPITNEPVPELATHWKIREDGLIWIFTIRNDVPWVRWNPNTQEGEIVRMVTAHDFVYGIKRGCDPALENYYSDVIGPLIAGCDVQAAQVRALDDTTLEIHMQNPAGYFPAVAVLPILRAVPPELITARDHWTDLGVILTNGPFMLDDWHPNVRYGFRRNPFLPNDLRGPGNVEVVRIAVVDSINTAFTLYQTQDVDVSPIAYLAFKDTLADPTYSDQLFSYSDQAVFVIAFAYAQEPFDNVHVRRAFSAAIDRNLFVEEIRQQRGYGMIHFAPPDLSGALPLDEVGMGYDPAYARAELALAGYPNCEGFPEVVMYAYQGAGPWMEFLASNLREVLGCDPELFIIEQEEFAVLIDPPYPEPGWIPSDWPPVFTLGEGVDYPDVQSVFDTFPPCGADISPNPEDRGYTWLFWMNWTFIQRPCTEADTLLAQAAAEPDPQIRADLYRQIEELWFGPEGEFPVIPLFTRRNYMLHQPWITGPFDTDWTPWGPHYDWYTIDAVAQN